MNTSEYMLNIIHEIHSEYTSAIESIDHFGHWATASTSTPPFPRRRGPRRSTLGPSPWARRIPSRAFDGCGGLAHAPEIMGPGLLVPWVPCSQTKDFQRLPTFIFSFCLGNFRLETIQISSLLISFNGVIRFSGTWVQTRELSLQTARANIFCDCKTPQDYQDRLSLLYHSRVIPGLKSLPILEPTRVPQCSTMLHGFSPALGNWEGLCWALSGLTCPQRVHRAFMVKFFPPQGQIHPIQAFSALSLAHLGSTFGACSIQDSCSPK